MTRLDRIDPGPVVNLIGVENDHLFDRPGMDPRKAADALDELPICFWIVYGPIPAHGPDSSRATAVIRVLQPRESKLCFFASIGRGNEGCVVFEPQRPPAPLVRKQSAPHGQKQKHGGS